MWVVRGIIFAEMEIVFAENGNTITRDHQEMTASGVAPSLRHYSSAIFSCALGENPGEKERLPFVCLTRTQNVTV